VVGSDCALFLADAPVLMTGRGEHVERLGDGAAAKLRGRRVLVFKPAFGIATPWAYNELAALAKKAPTEAYLSPGKGGEMASAWSDGAGQTGQEPPLFNSLERPAFGKFVALPTLLAELRSRFALAPRMSGSGSACFALLPEDAPVAGISAAIRSAWGDSAWVIETRLG
jgi:4-diphosphocytidyl-2-C-methyl-D-erythritol kinase